VFQITRAFLTVSVSTVVGLTVTDLEAVICFSQKLILFARPVNMAVSIDIGEVDPLMLHRKG
jgi:hypothetical protein